MSVNIAQYGMTQRNLIICCCQNLGKNFGPPTLIFGGKQRLFIWRYKYWGVKLTTHQRLVLKLEKRGSMPPLLHMRSWRSQGQGCFAIKEYENLLNVKYNYCVSLPISIYSME